ncbi:MAG: histidine phosphatase family protein [Ilumatobacter sp.]
MGKPDLVYLVRHAKAGERRVWEGDDRARPLSKRGWRQSEAIAKRLEKHGATTLYSSGYVRCMQTLEPLARLLGTEVREEPTLFEYEPFEPVLDLLGRVEKGAVLCSHGDIIPATIQALHRRGMNIDSPPDWGKSSVWVLHRKGTKITRGKVWPAPC